MKKEIINYIFIILGSALMAFGVVAFLSPNNVAMGGTGGLSIILNKLFNISIGLLFAIINIPLLIISTRYLGKYFAIKSTIAIIIISFFIDIFTHFFKIPALSQETLLATLYGGISVGTGIGLIFKGGGSAGGGTIIARIITTKTSLKTGTVILILDSFVVMATAIVFNSIELALWSIISIYVTTKMIDVVLTGRPNGRVVHITSKKDVHQLGKLINDKIGVSGTIFKGDNLSLTQSNFMIVVTVPVNRLNSLKLIVKDYDNTANMIVMDASQVLGTKFIN
ncbi:MULTISPECIES: YitT family protein [unclassified Tenacibaculum]|uniref:YitT family protein n=1 Tax=unclassified Tenacibaculum TaxID=2635139 RepID=UPI001F360958|nr:MULTISPECIES: YitT family protein [unclassified Tenacibaculum]MCF2873401.1 YitT family protein [Tenacibaculum sp. Cn5-1]MCF2933557.1 YitT family protein [Tenacibaculum sp. Cn5-34]MCG7509861.1 YitT family protein [Tenacibaculum sp. Cn5-46]